MKRHDETIKTEKYDNEPENFQPLYLPFAEAGSGDETEDGDNLTCDFDDTNKYSEADNCASANPQPDRSPCKTTFYSETILSKKRGLDLNLFKQGRFAMVVAVFCIFGGVLMGVGVSILLSADSENVVSAHYATAVSAHPETLSAATPNTASIQPIQPFRLESADNGNMPSFVGDYTVSALMVSNHLVELISHAEPSVAAISITEAISDEASEASPFRMPNSFGTDYRAGGAGTGILFAEDDERVYIATNAHVIANANSVYVRVMDSLPVRARFIGANVNEDIAVISIKKAEFAEAELTDWSLAHFGDSDEVQVGQIVIAIGNALGGGNTVTNGIISTRQHEVTVDGREYIVLQSTAAINPGNSGGPLINMDGEVIGINTARVSVAYSVEGISYSITSNIAVPVIIGIMNSISDRPFLGIEGRTVPSEVAEMYGLLELGVFVSSVFNGSPAQLGGLERGDIITAIDGEMLMNMETLHNIITSRNIGDTVELRIIREGTNFMYLPVVLERHIDTEF